MLKKVLLIGITDIFEAEEITLREIDKFFKNLLIIYINIFYYSYYIDFLDKILF